MLSRADEKVLQPLDCLDSCLDGMIVLSYDKLSSPRIYSTFTILVTDHFDMWSEKRIISKAREQNILTENYQGELKD
jgi:hypothetical protein